MLLLIFFFERAFSKQQEGGLTAKDLILKFGTERLSKAKTLIGNFVMASNSELSLQNIDSESIEVDAKSSMKKLYHSENNVLHGETSSVSVQHLQQRTE